ncbi:MAG: YciI family protein [Acidimicrobiales bacterium]
MRGGEVLTTDGPFAETKEQLGGYYIIDVPDLDAALDWAAKTPLTGYGSVEVRPIMEILALMSLCRPGQPRRHVSWPHHARPGDLELAEDAAQDAFVEAAKRWVATTPDRPGAWLLTTARRKAIDQPGDASRWTSASRFSGRCSTRGTTRPNLPHR